MEDKKTWITIKDYAIRQGISYEAARQAVRRYKSQLQNKGHLLIENNKTWLDEEAVAFLQETHHKPKKKTRDFSNDWEGMDDKRKVNELVKKQSFLIEEVNNLTDMYLEEKRKKDRLQEELESTKATLERIQKKHYDKEAQFYFLMQILSKVKTTVISKTNDVDTMEEILEEFNRIDLILKGTNNRTINKQ